MSNGKKQQKKRKRHPAPFKSEIALRLEKFRRRRATRDLWGDNDDDDDEDDDKKSKTNNYKAFIASSESDEEQSPSPKRRCQNVKSRKNHVKNPTCLICSILSQLSSYNCCSEHLSILKNHSHQPQATTTTANAQWLPEQVMILPVTDEIVQRYLQPEQIRRLRTQTSLSPAKKKTSPKKSVKISDISESQQPSQSSQTDILPPLASTIVIEPRRSISPTIPPATTTESPKVTTNNNNNNTESITIIDIHQSTIQTITIDETQQVNNEKKQIDLWIPINDDVDAALEQALNQIDSSSDATLEFSPTTVRRTDTEYMAARLPKLSLKSGRFRRGKPITASTTTNAANEYRPLAATQSSPVTSSVITTNNCPPATTTTTTNTETGLVNLEDITDNILTQDVTIHLPRITTEIDDIGTDLSRSNENTHITSSTTNKKSTPSRVSFRLNPDGTRVSISRPALPTNSHSPLVNSLRRTSTDVTPLQPNTKQV